MLRDVFSLLGQLRRSTGRDAWWAELRALPRILRWVLPWALKAQSVARANPVHWLRQTAQKHPNRVAIRSKSVAERRELTFSELYAETARCASVMSHQGVSQGSVVALVARTGPALVITLGACWWLGAVPCLVDAETSGAELARLLGELQPSFLVELVQRSPDSPLSPNTRRLNFERACDANAPSGKAPSPAREYPPKIAHTSAKDCGLVLPTSGTESQAKLCKITLGRLVLSGHAFGGLLLKLTPRSVLYCPLPLTHATALTAGLMPAWVHGCTLHLPNAFSATQFRSDLLAAGATHVLYVGDLLRYALAKDRYPSEASKRRVRFVGNGLDARTWNGISTWFPRATFLEFYGATELAMLMVNLAQRPAAMGRVPFRAWSRYRVVEWQEDESRGPNAHGSPPRVARLCEPQQTGELLIAMSPSAQTLTGKFEGYLDPAQEHRAILRDVFVPGDRYYRTFDRVYYDNDDHFYFVERVGEIWRHSGHNVSTRFVAETLSACSCIEECVVVPVAIDDSPHRVALARVTLREAFDAAQVMGSIASLPSYAQPTFVQIVPCLERTRTYKARRNAAIGPIFPGGDVEGLYVRVGSTLAPFRAVADAWRPSPEV